MAYGLTAEGFIIPSQQTILEGLKTRVRSKFGASLPLDSDTVEGHFAGIVSEAIAHVWEGQLQVYSSGDPRYATGQALVGIAAITGTQKPPATYSAVVQTFTGSTGATVPINTIVRTESTEKTFITTMAGVTVAAGAWLASTAYSADDRVTNGGFVFLCTTGGTSAASGGPDKPDPVDDPITDGGVTWRYLGDGVASIDVPAQATEVGPIVGSSGDINEIVTPVGSIDSTINILDANTGSATMTDERFRIFRRNDLAAGGAGTIPAIVAKLKRVSGVTDVVVFENTTAVTVDGLPPAAIEAMVTGGDPAAIRQALLAFVSGGIQAYGTDGDIVYDSQGIGHFVAFSRPEELEIYVTLVIEKDIREYPTNGNDQVKQAIVDWGDVQANGKNAVAKGISAQAFKVTGVLDVPTILISAAPVTVPVASTTIQISRRQRAVYDTGRISVTTFDGEP